VNSVQYTLNSAAHQVNADHPSEGDKKESWQMRILVLVAAAVGLGAVLAGNVLPDVTRYLRMRRM
jgi:hypothetical protein